MEFTPFIIVLQCISIFEKLMQALQFCDVTITQWVHRYRPTHCAIMTSPLRPLCVATHHTTIYTLASLLAIYVGGFPGIFCEWSIMRWIENDATTDRSESVARLTQF